MEMNGLTHLLARVAHVQVSVDIGLIVGAAIAAALFLASKRGPLERFLVSGVCSVVLVIGLHTYDLMLTILLLPWVRSLSTGQKVSAGVGFLMLWRPENLSRLLVGSDMPVIVADLTTAASVLLCLPFVIWLLASPRPDVRRTSEGAAAAGEPIAA